MSIKGDVTVPVEPERLQFGSDPASVGKTSRCTSWQDRRAEISMRLTQHPFANNPVPPTSLTSPEILPAAAENALLAALSPTAMSRLHRHVHRRDLGGGALLWDAGEIPDRMYFPCSGMISIRVPAGNGPGIEVATVGREGATGFEDNLGPGQAITRAVVQVGGQFASVPKHVVAVAAREHEQLRYLVNCCNHWLLLQAQQIAACNVAHSAEARLCRWLLRTSDAVANKTIWATQESIAEALGVRRTTATMIAQRLQQAQLIGYSRGKIVIRNRAGLEAAACDCHAILGRRNWPSELIRIGAGPSSDRGA